MPWCPQGDADRLLEVMRNHPLGQNAAIIGQVVDDHPGMVTMHSLVGGERVVTMLAGEQLPQDLLTPIVFSRAFPC